MKAVALNKKPWAKILKTPEYVLLEILSIFTKTTQALLKLYKQSVDSMFLIVKDFL